MKDENPFKEKLYHHTLPVSDELWNRIELQLPVGRKRFPFFWFTLASAVLIVGAFLVWQNQPLSENKDNQVPEKKTVPAHPDQNVTPASDVSTSERKPDDIQLTSATSANVSTHGKDTRIQSKTFPNKSSVQKKKNTEANYNSAHNLETEATVNLSLSNQSTQFEENFTTSSVLVFRSTTLIPFSGIDFVESEALLSGITSIKPDPSCYKFTGQEKKSNLSLDLFASPGFAPRTFESSNTESIIYAEAREATEENRYAWGAGARINLKINHEWAVRSGIMYEQIGDVFDYTDTLATKQTTQIDSFFAADGTFLYTQTSTVLIFGTLIKKIHNRYHRIDIPLLASYELPMGRGILMVNAGPVINLTSSSRGQILNPLLVPQHLTAGAPNQLNAYKTNLGLSIYIGAGALIPINKNFSGLIEPRFLYRIKPVTNENYPIKEYRHYAGLNLGIRYHFN